LKNKHYILFAVILVSLLTIYLFLMRTSRITEMSTGYESIFPDFNIDKVRGIRAFRPPQPENGVIMVREGESWVVKNKFDAKGDQQRISHLLSQVKDLKGELRSQEPSTFPVFELEEEKSVHVVFNDSEGKTLAHFLFGKRSEDGTGCFLRKAGENRVYLVSVNFVSTFQVWQPKEQPSAIRWCDLKLIRLSDPFKVKTCTLSLPNTSVTFEKQEIKSEKGKPRQQWVKIAPAAAPAMESTTVDPIVNTILGMRGEDVVDPDQAKMLDFSKAPFAAKFTLADGSSSELRVVEKDNFYYGSVKDERHVYRVPKMAFDASFGKMIELLKPKDKAKSKSK
jgi:hypothetical protein